MSKRKLQSEFESVKNEKDESLHIQKKRKIENRKFESNITITIDSDDDDVTIIQNKKPKSEKFFLITIPEDAYLLIYELNTNHKLFKPLVEAYNTKQIQENDQYPTNEVNLFNLMIELSKNEDNSEESNDENSEESNGEMSYDSFFLDSEKEIKEYLSIDNLKASDFYGLVKNNQFSRKGLNLQNQRELLNGRAMYMISFC